jgi:predicted metal-dependent phosphoesterase TrpH
VRLKIDLHVHTEYSADSIITLDRLLRHAKEKGLDAVAITDHDTLEGAARYSKETNFLIVPGMEITSLNGHIIALDVDEPISKNLTIEETVDRIHSHGGIAIACHPTVLFKGSVGSRASPSFDAVEVVNASAIPFGRSVRSSRKMALSLGLPQVGGSDAHYGPEIGCAYTVTETEPNISGIVKALKSGHCEPAGGSLPLTLRMKREIALLRKRTTNLLGACDPS